jgi:hypothetical protein
MSMALMPIKGTMMPPDAVDQQVVAQQNIGRLGLVLDALEGQRDEGHDDQRVEDDRGQNRPTRANAGP